MPNQQLIDFIKKSKAAGQTDKQIKSALLNTGWRDNDINEVLNTSNRKNKINPYLYILLSGTTILITLAGIFYFINSHDKKEPILEFKEDFKTADFINKDQTSLILDLNKRTVHLPFNTAKDISSYVNNLPDFQRIKAIGTDGNKFLIAAESYYQAGTYPIILEYSNGQWNDLSSSLNSALNTRNLEINAVSWGQNYWLIGGSIFNEDYNGYFLIKYKDGKFINLTKFLPSGDYSLNINSLSYAPQKGWLIGAWYNSGSYIIKYDGEQKFNLLLNSRDFQVQAIDNDGEDFVIGGTHSTMLLYHNNVLSNYYASVKQILGNEWGVITSVRFDKNSKNYSRWLLTVSRGPILEFDLSLLKKADNIYKNIYTLADTNIQFKNSDLLIVTTDESQKSGDFIKVKINGEKVNLSSIVPQTDLNGLRFIAVGNNKILVGNAKNLFEIDKPQLYLNTASIQSKPVSEQIGWYKTIKKVKLNSDTLEGKNIKFYLSSTSGKDWQEISKLDEYIYINTGMGRNLTWKAKFFSDDGDSSPYLNRVNIFYQLGFSKIIIVILLILVAVIEMMLAFFIYRFFIVRV